MFQPKVKLEFVRRYLNPSDGWRVFVDIDPSEEGRTGSWPTPKSRARRDVMQETAASVRIDFTELGVTVGGSRKNWFIDYNLPFVEGDRDIIAFQPRNRLLVIAEIEGVSSGQPEQKLYKAVGQIVVAASTPSIPEWNRTLVLVVYGHKIAAHLQKVTALEQLGVSAVAIEDDPDQDRWLFGQPPSSLQRCR